MPAGVTLILKFSNSKSIREAEYDPEGRTMAVTFTSGAVYRYREFPYRMILRWVRAKSAGQFFAKEVRPHYSVDRREWKTVVGTERP